MLFFYDESMKLEVSFEQFYSDLTQKANISKYIYSKNTYDVILEIAAAIIYGREVILLDGDFSEVELHNLGISKDDLAMTWIISPRLSKINHLNFNNLIIANNEKARIGIFTSGTTGKPKCFYHTLKNLLRNIKISENHAGDIWALAYSITHFAGIQVLLQALLNHNTIIDVFGANSIIADRLLKNYRCNCISSTPTFFRNYLFSTNTINERIKTVTFGGEKFNVQLMNEAKKKFPHAKIRNIYASTEVGSILSGNGENFIIPIAFKDKIRVSAENHLLLHASLLDNIEFDGDWYDTKDIVSVNEDGSFKFLSRNTDFVNVGGYKVNLLEIEEEILKVDGVIDVVVYGRDNSVIGKILVADILIIDNNKEAEVKKNINMYLRENLQTFKVPRIINVVKELKKNRTGKKVR